MHNTASTPEETGLSDWDTIDFFTDESLVEDPYPYFEHLRAACPVQPLPHHGVVAVTGYDEATEVYRDVDTFSSCNSVIGPFATFPVPLEGDDVGDIIDRYRDQLPMHEHMVTMDPPAHTQERALLMRLITPKRLKDNEEFMWRLADQQLGEFVGDGHCEFISAYTQPFAMLVVADLLGVPEADHQRFREFFGLSRNPGEIGAGEQGDTELNALGWLDDRFAQYIEDRRREPRNDVLTHLALATYPDGTTPEVINVVRTATFLFAAGQETTARLLAAALKHPRRAPRAPGRAAGDRDRIPNFLEEVLRIESPVKADFRLARRSDNRRRRRHRRGHARHAAERRRQPRPPPVRVPGRVPIDRPNAQSHIALRPGQPLVSRCALGALRGPGQPRAHPRPDARHPPLRGAPRPAGARRFNSIRRGR